MVILIVVMDQLPKIMLLKREEIDYYAGVNAVRLDVAFYDDVLALKQ